jgi:hypothetical protein
MNLSTAVAVAYDLGSVVLRGQSSSEATSVAIKHECGEDVSRARWIKSKK